MIILSLDPATSTGYCLVKLYDNKRADIYEYGYLDVDTSSEYQGDHCIDLMEKIQKLIDAHQVKHITIEDYFFSPKFISGCSVNVAFRAAIHILARQNQLEYTILNISAWKMFVAGRATPTKEQKEKWGADAAKKLYMQEALWNKWKFRFPNHSISEKTHKPITFRYDIVDVVAQCIYYCCATCQIPPLSITLSVPVAQDVIFKRPGKKQFIYPNP